MQDIQDAYRLIQSELKAMEELIFHSLQEMSPFVGEVVQYSFRLSGKRLRPALLFLVGKAMGTITDTHIRAAAAIELVHTASLIHDDILDGASIRRHLETINLRWSAQVGVLAGDILLSQAMEFISHEDNPYGFRCITKACKKTCEGELAQIATVGRFDLAREEYDDIIAKKTAPLLECSAELGAFYAGADEVQIERFRLFGHHLGLAFQIVDDILDVVGSTAQAGKTLRTDLISRKPTLPIILYQKNASSEDRNEMLSLLHQEKITEEAAERIALKLQESGAVEEAKKEASHLIAEATAMLDTNHPAMKALKKIAEFVGYRTK